MNLKLFSDGGVCEETVDPESSTRLCVSDKEAVTLARLAVCLERLSGGPRDIEFALSGAGVHVLQARPITTLLTWSDNELEREFDSGVASKTEDWFTTANIGYESRLYFWTLFRRFLGLCSTHRQCHRQSQIFTADFSSVGGNVILTVRFLKKRSF